MAEQASGGQVQLRYVTRTPTAPGLVAWLVALSVMACVLALLLFVVDPGGRPMFANIIFCAAAALMVLSNLLFHAGNQGRLGKRVIVDSSGVSIESWLGQRAGRPRPIHLPVGGLIYHVPDDKVAAAVRDKITSDGSPAGEADVEVGSGAGSGAGPVMRWVHAEQAPPTQHRIVLGHRDPTVTWQSLPLRDAGAFLEALRQLPGVPEPGQASSGIDAPESSHPLDQSELLDQSDRPVDDDSSTPMPVLSAVPELLPGPTARILIGLGVVGTLAFTAWLRHSGWPAMMLAAALVPLGIWYVYSVAAEVVAGHDPAMSIPGRAVGHVVHSRDGSSYRKARRYLADVVVITPDGRRLVKEAGGMTRCPLPNGSPVPVLPTPSGRPPYVIDQTSLGFTGQSSLTLVMMAILVVAVWLLWVFDAIIGGL